MDKCCGTCGRWQQDRQERRPASLRTMFSGYCKLKGCETKHDESCWGWAQAEKGEVEKRGVTTEAAQLN